jgi:hypothetical protein
LTRQARQFSPSLVQAWVLLDSNPVKPPGQPIKTDRV